MKKSELAQIIYEEVNADRKSFIDRVKKELDMSDAGASTYYYNCKKKASDSGDSIKELVEKVSFEDVELFEVNLKDGTSHSFMKKEYADEFAEKNKSQVI